MSLLRKAFDLQVSVWPKIVTVGIVCGDHVLTGKRRDNGLWTSPGGHLDDGEALFDCARREVLEESGIKIEENQLEVISADRFISHRTGKPFIVIGFIANIPTEQKATAVNDPDDEIEEWKWVPISRHTPELQASVRHAKNDMLLLHLGLIDDWRLSMGDEKKMPKIDKDPRDQGRGLKDVSDDIQRPQTIPGNGQQVAEEEPKLPEPKPKTPEEMKANPEDLIRDDNVTGD